MKRLKIEMPDRLPFQTTLEVRIGEINYGGHLGNDALLSLLHEARLRFLKTYGFSERDAGGAGLILTEIIVAFRAQAYHGDVLTAEVGVGEIGACGFTMLYRLTRSTDQREIARAQSALAFYNYAEGRVVRTPELFRQRITAAPA